VDGFDEDEGASEGNQGSVVPGGLFAAECDAFEALELADRLLDPGSAFVEDPGKELGFVGCVGAVGDNRADAAASGSLPVRLRIVSFIGQRSARRNIRADIKQGLELTAVAGLAAREMKRQGLAIEVGLKVNLGREPAT